MTNTYQAPPPTPTPDPCEIEFLTQEQFKNSSWNLAWIFKLFKNNCTCT